MTGATGRGFTVHEVGGDDRPIELSPETTAAFVGRALRGPLDTPVLVGSFGEFRRRFGDCWSHSSLGPSVRAFFENGGRRLYVVRVANHARGALLCLPASGSALILRAVEPGSAERLRAAVDYDGIDGADGDRFNLTLQRCDPGSGRVLDQEMYRALSHVADSPDFVGERLAASDLARAEAPWPTRRPDPTLAGGSRYAPDWAGHVQPGTDGGELSDYDLIGSQRAGTGLFALDAVADFDLLYLPPRARATDTGPAATLAAELYARARGAMLIVDPPAAWATCDDAVRGLRTLGYASPNACMYFPRPGGAPGEPAPVAGGALAGTLCRNDRRRGPGWSFAEDGLPLKAGLAPASMVNAADARQLVLAGINPLVRDATGRVRLTGCATLARGSESHRLFKCLATRRLCLRVVNTIDRATRWTVFERADGRLVARVRHQVADYLGRLHAEGVLVSDDFLVLCDAGSRPASGNCRHGITLLLVFQPQGCRAPLSFTLHQSTSGCRVSMTAFAPFPRG
ncbi:MAG TPA: hypothetical protein VFY03_08325 [Woeseiaceae bacterium]|nr:hypothetical protein [Woeseiaceae bacterium]